MNCTINEIETPAGILKLGDNISFKELIPNSTVFNKKTGGEDIVVTYEGTIKSFEIGVNVLPPLVGIYVCCNDLKRISSSKPMSEVLPMEKNIYKLELITGLL